MNILVPGAEFGAEIGEVAEFWDCLISRQHYVRRCFFLSRLFVNAFSYFTLMGAGRDDIGGIVCRANLLWGPIGGPNLRSLLWDVNLGIENLK